MARQPRFIKVYPEKWFWGSTRSELNPDERSVWIDFLCLASNGLGEIEVPSRKQLARQLCISRGLLNRSIDKFLKNGKIEKKPEEPCVSRTRPNEILSNFSKNEKVESKNEEARETFKVVNWDKYQADYLKKPGNRES